ncbi:MAG: AbiV family abortive infection protein [Alphaproteobacteria bacterium]|nr:AbiV family abortive infection protein [Alphaproteobacteria bacterium]
MKLNYNTKAEMAILSFQNAIKLHNDSWILYKNKSYSTAYYISVVALEEFGKMQILNYHAFYGQIVDESHTRDIEFENEFNNIYLHSSKQENAIDDFVFHGSPETEKRFQHILGKQYNKTKEDSIYVGIRKSNRGNIKIINPLEITRKQTLYQISLVQELLLDAIVNVKKVGYYYDTLELTYFICKHGTVLYRKLKNLKIPISKEMKQYFKAVERDPTKTKADYD